jgi:hypothetical protein
MVAHLLPLFEPSLKKYSRIDNRCCPSAPAGDVSTAMSQHRPSPVIQRPLENWPISGRCLRFCTIIFQHISRRPCLERLRSRPRCYCSRKETLPRSGRREGDLGHWEQWSSEAQERSAPAHQDCVAVKIRELKTWVLSVE